MIQQTLITLGGTLGVVLVSSLATSRTYLSAKRHGKPTEKRESWDTEKWLINFAVSIVITAPLFGLGIVTNQQEALFWVTAIAPPVALGVQKLVDVYQRTGDITEDQLKDVLSSTVEDLLTSENSPLRGLIAGIVEEVVQNMVEDDETPLTTETSGATDADEVPSESTGTASDTTQSGS